MTDTINNIKANAAKLETPFLIRHVEEHLIFGPISRHISFGYLVLCCAILSLVAGFFATSKGSGQYIGNIFDKLIFLIAPLLLVRMTYRQQAIIGWIAFKFGVGLVALMLMTIGAGASFMRGRADAWPNLLLGMIWIPGIEFIPKVTPYQRYVTLARIALSIPCIYYGVRSGNWR